MSLPRLLTLAEVATYLDAGEGRVTERYVEDLINGGHLAGVRVAAGRRVSETAVADFVAAGGKQRKRRSDAAPIPAAPVQFPRRTRSRAS